MDAPDALNAAEGMRDFSIHELTKPIYRAVMLSMSFTGQKGLVFNHVSGEMREGEFFSHDNYDEAMAAVGELVRRAKLAGRKR